MHDPNPEYSDEVVDYLQLFRGEGFLSPGGADETRRVLDRVEITGKRVLEVGSGLGGCCLIIAGERGAAEVLGLDVEPVVLERARRSVEAAGLADRVSFRQVEPGPLPVADASFDVVFSKDAMCHIEDKAALYAELFRVLVPGGRLAIADWLVRDDEPRSPEMDDFIGTTSLSFHLDSLDGMARGLAAAGFVDVEVVNRNEWFREEARREAELLEGPLLADVEQLRGAEATARSNECQWQMIAVLDSGEFCPAHAFAHKPA
jgi:SAM-dependent methyltransferase